MTWPWTKIRQLERMNEILSNQYESARRKVWDAYDAKKDAELKLNHAERILKSVPKSLSNSARGKSVAHRIACYFEQKY